MCRTPPRAMQSAADARKEMVAKAGAALTELKTKWPYPAHFDGRTYHEVFERLYEWQIDWKAEGVPEDVLFEVAATSLGWTTDDVDEIFSVLETIYFAWGYERVASHWKHLGSV